jgi:hypothetical protein
MGGGMKIKVTPTPAEADRHAKRQSLKARKLQEIKDGANNAGSLPALKASRDELLAVIAEMETYLPVNAVGLIL